MVSKKRGSKNSFYWTVLEILKQEGTNLQNIRIKTGLNKQKLNYYLRQLESKGLIKKVSKGYYEVKHIDLEHAFTLTKKEIRGHAFIWTIKLPKEIQGSLRNRLDRLNIKYDLVRGLIPRLFIKNRKVWLGKKTITIYDPFSYYGRNAIESKKHSVIALKEVLEALELELQIKLGTYYFKPAREHYGIVKNDLAVQCNRNGEKICVRDDLEGEWMWIDDSDSLGELETGGTKALVRNVQVQKWFNDMKKTNFEVTPTFLLKSINQVTQNQLMFNQNFESHVEAIQTLSQTVKELRDEVLRLKNENKSI